MSEEYYHNLPLEALDDLACRFLLNIPETDKNDPIRWGDFICKTELRCGIILIQDLFCHRAGLLVPREIQGGG